MFVAGLDFYAHRGKLSSAMRHLDLFSGSGTWALAARHVWDDYECVGFCETDWFCRMVLQTHFPGVPIYEDIRTLTDPTGPRLERGHGKEPPLAVHRGRIDLLTASPPCQAASHAGRRRGKADDRWLWPETLAVIQAIKPTWCILENVYGILTLESGLVFEELCLALERFGYEVQPFIIPAVAVNAPHRRDRVWIVANTNCPTPRQECRPSGHKGRPAVQNRADRLRPKHRQTRAGWFDAAAWQRDWREVAAATCVRGLDDGTARRLVRFPDGTVTSEARWRKEALKALGNAIVGQVAVEIMRAIKAARE